MVDRKNFLRNWIMKIGENSVGKSLLFGTYDPLIPDELKREVQKQKSMNGGKIDNGIRIYSASNRQKEDEK